MRISTIAILLVAVAGWARAASVPPPAPGTGTLWGVVKLTPREGVKIPKGGGDPYQSRKLRDVELVDYSHPGFAVLYLEDRPVPAGEVRLALDETRWRRRIAPGHAAVGQGGRILLENATTRSHTISCPSLGVLRRLDAGQEIELVTEEPGPLAIHVLDESVTATVFVAPGPYTVASKRGRWVLADLAPGSATLRVWHPRFPGGARSVEIAADGVERLDLEIGVDHLGGSADR